MSRTFEFGGDLRDRFFDLFYLSFVSVTLPRGGGRWQEFEERFLHLLMRRLFSHAAGKLVYDASATAIGPFCSQEAAP